MKKSLLFGLLGLVSTHASLAANSIYLESYYADPMPLITYGANVYANGKYGAFGVEGTGLNSSWTVGIYYAAGVVTADPAAGNGPVSPQLSLATGPNSTAQLNPTLPPGAIAAGTFVAPGYFDTGLPFGSTITFELVAYPTVDGSYDNAISWGDPRGHSPAFTMPTQQSPLYIPNGVGDYFSSFSVALVPEPGISALMGLCGASMLLGVRHRKT